MKLFLTKFLRTMLRWSSRRSRTLRPPRNSTATRSHTKLASRTASLATTASRSRTPPRRRILRRTIIPRRNTHRIVAEIAAADAILDAATAEVIADVVAAGDVAADGSAVDARRVAAIFRLRNTPHHKASSARTILAATSRAARKIEVTNRATIAGPKVCATERLRLHPIRMKSRSYCPANRSEEHTSELQSRSDLVCRLLLE